MAIQSGSRRIVLLLAILGAADAFLSPPLIIQRPGSNTVPKSLVPSTSFTPRFDSNAARAFVKRSLRMQAASPAITPENPLKVLISGGGVGGLFLAKALQKKGCVVTVLEKTSKFARFGGPIQLASNALATIKGIDEDLFNEVMQKFTFTGTRTCGIKDGIRSTEAAPKWYTKFEAITNMAEYFSLPYTGVVDRPDLQVLTFLACRLDLWVASLDLWVAS